MPGTAMVTGYQPGGVFTITDANFTTGTTRYVGSSVTGATDGTGYGSSPSAPYATFDYAVGQCAENVGDTIIILSGHAETISSATGMVLDKAGVRVKGLGIGTNRPTFTFSATASILSITAANSWVENIRIVGDIDNIVTAISYGASADGGVLKNVQLVDGASNKEFLVGIAIAAACHNLVIEDCQFFGLGGGATAAVSLAGASDNLIFRRNMIQGTFSTGLIDASAAASVNLAVHDNWLVNRDTSAGLVWKGHASNSGFLFNNFVAGTKNNTETINTVGNMHFGQNWGTDTVGTKAIETPSTATAWT